MERLSDRAIAIVNELHTERLDYQSEYLPLIDALNQLAAFEDTGLTPEALKKPFTEDALLILAASVLRIGVDRLRELAQADKDGRLVVLPCKVGDTVYARNHHGRIVDGDVQSIHQNYVAGKAGRWVVSVYYPEYNGTAESGLHPDFLPMNMYYGLDDFGKTVFLTREEAERALEEVRGNG